MYVAADDQVLPIVGPAADQDVDVRIVGVPVIDRHPVEPRAEISFDVVHQLAGEGARSPSSAASSGEMMKRK